MSEAKGKYEINPAASYMEDGFGGMGVVTDGEQPTVVQATDDWGRMEYRVVGGGVPGAGEVTAPDCVMVSSAQVERWEAIEECAKMLAQVVQEPLRTVRWLAMSKARALGLVKE
jgi:hypothetical protein